MSEIRVTVAAIVEQDGRFLMVEEHDGQRLVFNQPAGHVETGEPFIQAVIRETLEESAYAFEPEAVVGIYRWQHPDKGTDYLRVTFCGQVRGHDPDRCLDDGIVRAVWLTRSQLEAQVARMRSPLVLRSIDDYVAGLRFPLHCLSHVDDDLLARPAAAADF
jgi:ADP-ribose pyrophosphatase YjhB (NUDIX family)